MTTKYFHFYLLICILFSLTACKEKTPRQRTVSVSILPQQYLVKRIAGDHLQVNVMIPPGMNPATCDLSTGQLKKLYDSDICFTVGYLPFELTHLYPVLKNREQLKVINHSENLTLLSGGCGHQHDSHHEHGGVDPHIWLSPAYAQKMATTIYQVLSEQYPEQAQEFKTNYESLTQDIDNIANKAEQVLKDKKDKTFLIYHPALTYLANDYGMEQISIEDEGKEPNPAHLKEIIDLAREKNIRIIFIQSQFDMSNAESVARQIGAHVISIDPLSADWLGEMNKLIRIFETELE